MFDAYKKIDTSKILKNWTNV